MRTSRFFATTALSFLFAIPAFTAAADSAHSWDLEKLFTAPPHEWLDAHAKIRTLLYEGEPYHGNATHVFAYYASPETLGTPRKTDERHPGVVLIHGGGGTAFPQWAELWAKRGYAAIAMDLSGRRPDVLDEKKKPSRLPDGGPEQGTPEKFESIATEDVTDDWPYHAVANSIRAHSLLRSFSEVDKNATAVTGISWGGYTCCIVASLDHRFKAAVPVYGCGFLHENSAWLDQFARLGPENSRRWVKLYDPSSHLPRCRVPIFFVNDTNDFAYPLDSYMKSWNAVTLPPKNIRLDVTMKHGHESGWAPKEIGLFVGSTLKFRGEKPLPVCAPPEIKDGQFFTDVVTTVPLKSASLHYALPGAPINKREWKTLPATFKDGVVTAPMPPADADMAFLTVTDERDATVSSIVKFLPGR